MVYENCRIYGPYQSKQDSRLRIVVCFDNRTKKTVSYPKYLMEKHLGRYLTDDETVDHIDCNFLNNEISNLRVLPRSLHASVDAKRKKNQTFECPMCKMKFSLVGDRLHDAIQNRRKGKAGPFCSKSCAGKYGKSVQLGEDKMEVVEIIPTYTTIKSDGSLDRETYQVDIAKTVNA
jgi:hypothetical protein